MVEKIVFVCVFCVLDLFLRLQLLEFDLRVRFLEFAGVGDDRSYGVDLANVEIRTKGAKYTAKHTVSAPVAKPEEKKKKLYIALCKETRDVTFIPAVMSSFSAPGKGMSNLVRVLAERLQLIEGGDFPACKRKVLRRFQVVCMREIARNGAKAMHEHRVEICKERRLKHIAAAAPAHRI